MSLGAEFALTKPGTLSEGTTAFHDEPQKLRHTRGSTGDLAGREPQLQAALKH